MRLWTLHPAYLDAKGLVALWRETLLAQAVLKGQTKGYRNHPQLIRFQSHDHPLAAMATYLAGIHDESRQRGYHFDASKIGLARIEQPMNETLGQVLYEWSHLKQKLAKRSPEQYQDIAALSTPKAHPLFNIIPGDIQDWERL